MDNLNALSVNTQLTQHDIEDLKRNREAFNEHGGAPLQVVAQGQNGGPEGFAHPPFINSSASNPRSDALPTAPSYPIELRHTQRRAQWQPLPNSYANRLLRPRSLRNYPTEFTPNMDILFFLPKIREIAGDIFTHADTFPNSSKPARVSADRPLQALTIRERDRKSVVRERV